MSPNLAMVPPEETESLVVPEIPTGDILDVEAMTQLVTGLEAQAKTLLIHDDASEEAGLLFISECKRSYAVLEDQRTGKVKAHNDYVKRVNKAFGPFTDILDRLWRATDIQRSAYLKKKEEAIAEANRRAIAEAEKARLEQEKKAREAREEAERLRIEAERVEQERVEREFLAEMERLELERKRKAEAQAMEDAAKAGDMQAALEAEERFQAAKWAEQEQAEQAEKARKAAEEEKLRLEKAAIKQDMKADTAASVAMMTTPEITGGTALGGLRTLLNGAKVGGRKVVTWFFENGMPIDGDYYADDVRVKDIPARYFLLDVSKLGKDVKNGVPVPGTGKSDGTATTNRRA